MYDKWDISTLRGRSESASNPMHSSRPRHGAETRPGKTGYPMPTYCQDSALKRLEGVYLPAQRRLEPLILITVLAARLAVAQRRGEIGTLQAIPE